MKTQCKNCNATCVVKKGTEVLWCYNCETQPVSYGIKDTKACQLGKQAERDRIIALLEGLTPSHPDKSKFCAKFSNKFNPCCACLFEDAIAAIKEKE